MHQPSEPHPDDRREAAAPGRPAPRRPHRLLTAGIVVLSGLVVLVGLVAARNAGGPSAGTETTGHLDVSWDAQAERSKSSSPFRADWAPEGFEPVAAGVGEDQPAWGDDSFSTHEPTTILAPIGEEPTAANTIAVSVTGYAGYEDGLRQATKGSDAEAEQFLVDGREALFTRTGWAPGAEVVVAVEDDLAIRVEAAGLTREELVAIAAEVRPQGQVEPPDVAVPAGLRIVGSSDARFALARDAYLDERAAAGPGPEGAHGFGWRSGETELVVLTLPGVSADPAVLLAEQLPYLVVQETTTVDAGSGQALHQTARPHSCEDPCQQLTGTLVATTPWGDVVVVSATGPEPPSGDHLARIAASVEVVDDAAWDDVVVELAGGPGLHPDEGMVEVARGTEGGVDWLLQAMDRATGEDHGFFPGTEPMPSDWPEDAYVTDACLKLSTGRRVCTDGLHGTPETWTRTRDDPEIDGDAPEFPRFVIVDTTTRATAIRVRTNGRETTGDLHLLPGTGPRWAGVVFVDRPDDPVCSTPGSVQPRNMQVDLVDEPRPAGTRCIGAP